MSAGNRLLAPFLFALLVVATLFAFLVVERERNHPTILEHTKVTPSFEPAGPPGSGLPRRARLRFLLTHAEPHTTIVVVDPEEAVVDTLVAGVSLPDDSWHRYSWDGTTSSGAQAPPGLYRFRVILGDLGRNLPLPSMRLVAPPAGGG